VIDETIAVDAIVARQFSIFNEGVIWI